MSNYITIDGGTTNTRLSLVLNGHVTDTVKYSLGARASIEDKGPLRAAVREGIAALLSRNGLVEGDVHRILASGMITSEFGLYRLDHLIAPAGIAELHGAMEEVALSEISAIPFVFMRGVRTEGDLATSDIMRGEETELMGLSPMPHSIYILPGSHSKIIQTDGQGRIVSFFTTLTGEMIAALSQNTILKGSVSLGDIPLCKKSLLEGYTLCKTIGFNAALFKVRICHTLKSYNESERYSLFMGVILCEEVERIRALGSDSVTVGGKEQIREALCILLREICRMNVIPLTDEIIDTCVPLGAVRIFEAK